MTALLRQVMDQIDKLPEAKQDKIAEDLLEALEDARWDESFAREPEKLAIMADEARHAYHEGRTVDADSILG